MANSTLVLVASAVNAVGAIVTLFAMQQRTCSPSPLSAVLWLLRGSLGALTILFAINVATLLDGDPPEIRPLDLALQFACVLALLTGSMAHGHHRYHHGHG